MKTRAFLADVLPSPGHGLYCVCELNSRKKEHVFIDNIDEALPYVKQWVASHRDIYFALATFDTSVRERTKDRRTSANARFVKSFFIDMDGYESKKNAALALASFLNKTGLESFGTPHVVSSGGGLHCYWPLTETVDVTTWKPIAENFKRLCRQEGLSIDMTVTADAARVLRIPSTFNNKAKYETPREVKLLIEGTARVDVRAWGAAVRGLLREENAPASNAFVATSVDFKLDGTRPTLAGAKRSATAEALMQNSVTSFRTIWLKSENGTGCKQLEHYQQHASEDGMEPLWRGMLSWARVCEDSHEFTTRLTALHPYSPERMQQKLAEIKGPYPCSKIDSENPGVCQTCTYWGKVTNALALGREVKVDNRPKAFELPLQAGDDSPEDDANRPMNDEFTSEEDEVAVPQNLRTRTAERPSPPRGFDYGERAHSGVYVMIEEKDASGVKIKTQSQVLAQDLFVVDILRNDAKDHLVHMTAIKEIGAEDEEKRLEYSQIILPTKSVVSKEELLKNLAASNIYAAHGAAMDHYLYRYVRACVEEAARVKEAVAIPTQFGWQRDRSFVYNNRIFRPDGTEVAVPMPGLENLNRATNSKGTLEGWRKPWELLIKREMHTMLAMCVDSFGASLMHFSEQEGFTWHIGSTDSGTGKSLALSLKAGVWGHPIRYRTGKGTSPVAMQQRAGLLNSMPLVIDEITSKSRNDMEWVPAFIFDMAEGQAKERMESGSNRERVNNSTWALTCTMTSNMHMTDMLTGARKHSSHGEMMRMLEWTPTAKLQFTDGERLTLKELRRNYGVAAEAWIRWLVKNYALARAVWDRTHAKLRTQLGFTDEERYWHSACTCLITAAILLGKNYANLLELPVTALVKELAAMVEKARGAHVQSARDAEDVLNAYIQEFYGKFIVLRMDERGKILTTIGEDAMGKTSTRGAVMGRIEHGTINELFVEFFVEEQMLKKHCASMSFGYTDFKRQLEKLRKDDYIVKFGVRKDMLSRTEGPTLRLNVMHLSIPKAKIDAQENALPLVES